MPGQSNEKSFVDPANGTLGSISLKIPGSLPKCCLWNRMTVKLVAMALAPSLILPSAWMVLGFEAALADTALAEDRSLGTVLSGLAPLPPWRTRARVGIGL